MIKDLQAKILELKRENDVCILAHSYQAKEIVEVADFTGDSYQPVSYTHLTLPTKA